MQEVSASRLASDPETQVVSKVPENEGLRVDAIMFRAQTLADLVEVGGFCGLSS